MYNGYTDTTDEQTRARWELMQANAAKRAAAAKVNEGGAIKLSSQGGK